MAFLLPYAADLVTIVFAGRPLTAKADGDFVSIEPGSESATKYVGAGGDVAFAFNADRTATVTVTVMQNSPDNVFLSACEAARLIAPIEVKDLSTGQTLLRSAVATVMTRPTLARGKEIGTQEWAFLVGNAAMQRVG